MKLDFYISHNYTQRDLVLHPSPTTTAAAAATTTTPEAAATTTTTTPAAAATTTTTIPAAAAAIPAAATTPTAAAATTPAAATAAAVEIPPKTRYKQNEIHYQNSTHVIHLTLSKVEIPSFEYYTTHPKTP